MPTIISTITMLVTVMFLSIGSYAAGDKDSLRTDQPGVHIQVKGVISKIASGVMFVKTSTGGTISVMPDADLRKLKVGDEVTVSVNENNTVIDVHPQGHTGQDHRFASGQLTWASKDKKEIKLWTPEGEIKLPVSESVLLANIKEGTPITVEIDEGRVIDIHKTKQGLRLELNEKEQGGK
jgi:hypothetical protein